MAAIFKKRRNDSIRKNSVKFWGEHLRGQGKWHCPKDCIFVDGKKNILDRNCVWICSECNTPNSIHPADTELPTCNNCHSHQSAEDELRCIPAKQWQCNRPECGSWNYAYHLNGPLVDKCHCGYKRKPFNNLRVSVVGTVLETGASILT